MTPTDLNLFFVQGMLHLGKPRVLATRMWREKNRAWDLARNKRWKEKNPTRVRAIEKGRDQVLKRSRMRDYLKERRAKDPNFKLLTNSRTRINQALKANTKGAGTQALLGMEIREFKIYIQGQFLPGMTWENYGPVWHIDHIRPCDSFDLTDSAQQRECFNWSNCQPLLAEDNLRKGAYFQG